MNQRFNFQRHSVELVQATVATFHTIQGTERFHHVSS